MPETPEMADDRNVIVTWPEGTLAMRKGSCADGARLTAPAGGTGEASDVMSTSVVTTTPETTGEGVAQLMIYHRISGVPVTAGDGRLVGIVAEADLLRRAEIGTERRPLPWSERFSPGSRPMKKDGMIRSQLLAAELRKQRWADPERIAHRRLGLRRLFWGVVTSEEERRALRVLAENIPGVRGIEDHTSSAPVYP